MALSPLVEAFVIAVRDNDGRTLGTSLFRELSHANEAGVPYLRDNACSPSAVPIPNAAQPFRSDHGRDLGTVEAEQRF